LTGKPTMPRHYYPQIKTLSDEVNAIAASPLPDGGTTGDMNAPSDGGQTQGPAGNPSPMAGCRVVDHSRQRDSGLFVLATIGLMTSCYWRTRMRKQRLRRSWLP